MVAVQWYERLCESRSGERLEFLMGEWQLDVINSTELRLAAVAIERIGTIMAGVSDGGAHATGASAEAQKKWTLFRGNETKAHTWCR
jgi:hypothetical protein